MKISSLIAAQNSFDIEVEEIKRTKSVVDFYKLGLAVDVLSKAERISVSGCGHSGICCQHFAHLMCCAERPAKYLYPSDALHGGLGFIKSGDVLVLASRGGKTEELIPILKVAKDKGATVISITENDNSFLAENSDIVILMKVEKETDKYNSQSTSSFVALSSIFDALQAAVIEETDYKNSQFAKIHPNGAVGNRLNNATPEVQKNV